MRRATGFTLIEVLISLAIFAVLTLVAQQTISATITNAEILSDRMERLQQIQGAMRLLGRDLVQAAPRPIRDPLDDSIRPAFLVVGGSEFALEVTHTGWPNPAGLPRSTLQRAAYRIEDGELVRVHWTVLDPTLGTEPLATVLLDEVESLAFRFYLGSGQWSEEWPPRGAGGRAAAYARPRLVEVVLTLEDEGEITRWFEVAP